MNNITNNKKLLKIIIPTAIVLIIIVAGFIGYKVMKPTPEKTVQKYCDYLANKEYDKAYKMLYNTDNDFMSEEMFEVSLKSIDFKGYAIKDTNNKDYLQEYLKNSGVDIKEEEKKSASYEVQVQGKTYIINMLQNSNGLLFKDYKIDATKLATKWTITVPEGTEVYIGNKKIDKVSNTHFESGYDKVYDSKIAEYTTNNIFYGNYDVTLKLDGAEDIVEENVQAGKSPSEKFKPTNELSEQLKKQVKEFLTAYYNKDDLSKIVSSDSKIIEDYKGWQETYKKAVETLENDLTFSDIDLDDKTHVTVDVKYTINSTVYGSPEKYKKDKTIKFKKVDGKWVVCAFSIYS
ncbi:hypothetical protein NNC19_18895 [Clostridium sp. SHJSY1]|uniref:hypothetical protein n=1 Tax=Clostridium sp. SHJSY1 TaxID=2942483 RepID=UPI0028748AB2|nr:hypothetical protein [Clostridium sp. SHJSY1]MDS0527762.1 hypothetical protein [Clostridium sp. SHJSY1]